ncbi:hypothetical protein, partial [Xanthomonas oryzae]
RGSSTAPGSPGAVVVCIERNDLCAMEWNALGVSIPTCAAGSAAYVPAKPTSRINASLRASLYLPFRYLPCAAEIRIGEICDQMRPGTTWVLRCMQ